MNYRAALDDILTVEPLAEHGPIPQHKYVQMVKQGEQWLQQILQTVGPKQRAAVATVIVRSIIDKASTADYRLRPRPKWAPVREDILSEALTLGQRINNIAAYIATGLSGLGVGPETVSKIILQMFKRLKGNMEWNVNTPKWQEQHMGGAVEQYVAKAVQQGSGLLRFDAGSLNQSTQNNMLRYYNAALRKHGLVGHWKRQGDGSLVLDFRASLNLKRLIDIQAQIAKRNGPNANGQFTVNVGTVGQRIVAQGGLDAKTADHIIKTQLRRNDLDPARVVLSAAEPASQRRSARINQAPPPAQRRSVRAGPTAASSGASATTIGPYRPITNPAAYTAARRRLGNPTRY